MNSLSFLLALGVLTPFVDGTQAAAQAQSSPSPVAPTADIVTIRMKDGGTLHARIIDQNDERLKIVTVGGVAMEVPRSSVDRIDAGGGSDGPRPSDSNYTRLLFSPTGRPLGKGEGYFSDHYVIFPGVAYGITNNLSVGAGVSVVPGIGADEQLYYVSGRFGKQFSDKLAVSAGALYAGGGDADDETGLGVGFAVATFGQPDKSLTLGLGIARTSEHETLYTIVNGREQFSSRIRVSHTPVLIVGGTARISHRLAFVSENWLIFHDDFKLKEQPFAVGLRFLGDKLSADVGVILIGEVIEEGFPVPWLSMTYHFGPRR